MRGAGIDICDLCGVTHLPVIPPTLHERRAAAEFSPAAGLRETQRLAALLISDTSMKLAACGEPIVIRKWDGLPFELYWPFVDARQAGYPFGLMRCGCYRSPSLAFAGGMGFAVRRDVAMKM